MDLLNHGPLRALARLRTRRALQTATLIIAVAIGAVAPGRISTVPALAGGVSRAAAGLPEPLGMAFWAAASKVVTTPTVARVDRRPPSTSTGMIPSTARTAMKASTATLVTAFADSQRVAAEKSR